MKAIAFAAPGPPEVLEVFEPDDPRPAPDQALVRIRAAGVGPFDCAIRAGVTFPGFSITLPQFLGNEFAGVVEHVGADVHELVPGDEVLGWEAMACYAELVAVSPAQVVKKPPEMPWEQAGAMSSAGQAAHAAVSELGVSPGETILIHGAAGGVGTVAVQVARAFGATTVIGTASERNHEYLRSLGAVPVTYGDGLPARVRSVAPSGVDAVLDAAGGGALVPSLELVADRNRVATLIDFDAAAEHGARSLHTNPSRSRERLQSLVDLWTEGQLQIHVFESFPLAEASRAHRLVEARHVRGKVVLTMP